MALLLENHVHREAALLWWRAADATIAFTRFTQISVVDQWRAPAKNAETGFEGGPQGAQNG